MEKIINQLGAETFGEFWDAISGEVLDGELFEKAEEAEMETFKMHEVCEKVLLEERGKIIGRASVGVKWVETNKGDKE